MRRKIISIFISAFLFCLPKVSFAQFDLETFLKETARDGVKLVEKGIQNREDSLVKTGVDYLWPYKSHLLSNDSRSVAERCADSWSVLQTISIGYREMTYASSWDVEDHARECREYYRIKGKEYFKQYFHVMEPIFSYYLKSPYLYEDSIKSLAEHLHHEAVLANEQSLVMASCKFMMAVVSQMKNDFVGYMVWLEQACSVGELYEENERGSEDYFNYVSARMALFDLYIQTGNIDKALRMSGNLEKEIVRTYTKQSEAYVVFHLYKIYLAALMGDKSSVSSLERQLKSICKNVPYISEAVAAQVNNIKANCELIMKSQQGKASSSATADNVLLLYQHMKTACVQGDYATAKRDCQKILNFLEKSSTLEMEYYNNFIMEYVDVLMKLSEIDHARELLQHAEKYIYDHFTKNPNGTRMMEALDGKIAFQTLDFQGALDHLIKAKQMFDLEGDRGSSYYVNVLIPLASACVQVGDFSFTKLIVDEFEEFAKGRFLSADPEHIKMSEGIQFITLAMSVMCASLGYYDEAIQHLESIFDKVGVNQVGPTWDELRNKYAFILLNKKVSLSKSTELFVKNWEIGVVPEEKERSLIGLLCCSMREPSSFDALNYLRHFNNIYRERITHVLPMLNDWEKQRFWETQLSVLSLGNCGMLNAFKERDIAREMAYDNALYVKSMQDKRLHESPSWKDVKNVLSKNEVAIEFVYCPLDVLGKVIYFRLGALVIRKDSKTPQYVDLCKAEDVDVFRNIIHTDVDRINEYYDVNNTLLYSLIWKNIEPLLAEGDMVYYSATGPLARLNLEVLGDGQRRMNERFSFHQVSSTASIKDLKEKKWEQGGKAVIYGGLIYDEPIEEMRQAAKPYQLAIDEQMLAMRSLYQSDAGSRGAIDHLPGSLEEARFIGDILKKSGSEVVLLTEEQGNEESIKALSGHAPYILHIATHGFFLSTNEDMGKHRSILDRLDIMDNNQYSLMLYNGLLMSGANNAWFGRELPDNIEDGILTSYELSQIDLTGCRLTVLSACETGLGMQYGYVGDVGLKYALKLAGVQTIVASLWEVPDNATSILMKSLYENLVSGIEPCQALIKSREAVRLKYPQPYYWAGFFLVD